MKSRIIHINYFEGVYSLEESFRHCQEIGAEGIEVRDRDRSGKIPLIEYLEQTTSLAKQFSLEMIYGCRVETTLPDKRAREESIENFKTVIVHAQAQGCTLVNVFTGILWEKGLTYSQSGSALATPKHLAYDVACIRNIAAKNPTITFAMETHSGYLHDLAAPCIRFLEAVDLPNVKANLDFANIYLNRRGESLDKTMQLLRGKIGYLHLKNAKIEHGMKEGEFTRVPLDEGDIDLLSLLQQVKETGYAGPVCIENTMKTDKLPIAYRDFKTLSQWLANLK